VVELFAVIKYNLTSFKTKPCENQTTLLRSDNGVTSPPPERFYRMSIRTYGTRTYSYGSSFKIIAWNCKNMSRFKSAELFTLQLYEFAGFWMQCNSMFVITSHSNIFGLVTHSSPINRVGDHVFHRMQKPYVLKLQRVHVSAGRCSSLRGSRGRNW